MKFSTIPSPLFCIQKFTENKCVYLKRKLRYSPLEAKTQEAVKRKRRWPLERHFPRHPVKTSHLMMSSRWGWDEGLLYFSELSLIKHTFFHQHLDRQNSGDTRNISVQSSTLPPEYSLTELTSATNSNLIVSIYPTHKRHPVYCPHRSRCSITYNVHRRNSPFQQTEAGTGKVAPGKQYKKAELNSK